MGLTVNNYLKDMYVKCKMYCILLLWPVSKMIDRLLLKCCVEDSTCYFGNGFRLVVKDVYSVYSEAVSGQVSTRDMYTCIADPVSFIHNS